MWTPVSLADAAPTTSVVKLVVEARALAEHVATEFVRVLTAPVEANTAAERAEARENAIAALATRISAADVLALDRRLRKDEASDPVAVAFRRLTPERRARVLAALVERRKVLAGFNAMASSGR